MSSTFVVSFEQVPQDVYHLHQLGGKGYNLVKMLKAKEQNLFADAQIPTGFLLTADAYLHFLQQNQLLDKIQQLLADLCTTLKKQQQTSHLSLVQACCNECKQLIMKMPIPDAIVKPIAQHLQAFASSVKFAVRSSATSEDGAEQSFAGQHTTYLNCSNETQVIVDAVKKCWASLFNDGAIMYRLQQNAESLGLPLMCVVVQQMIKSEISGVMFTANIVNNNRRQVMIEASYGLGETIVSGKVKPDKYLVEKQSWKLLDKTIEEKTVAVVYAKDGDGTVEQEITESEGSKKQVLSDELVIKIAKIGGELETMYKGQEQDVEFGIHQGQFYLLQSRPVTSLFDRPKPIKPFYDTSVDTSDNKEHIYISFNHVQVMTDPITPFGMACIGHVFPNLVKRVFPGDAVKHRMVFSQGKMYIDMSEVLHLRLMRNGAVKNLSVIEPWIAKALEYSVKKPEFAESGARFSWKDFAQFIVSFMFFIPVLMYNMLFSDLSSSKAYVDSIGEQVNKATEQAFQGSKSTKDVTDQVPSFVRDCINIILNVVPRVFYLPVNMILIKLLTPTAHANLMELIFQGVALKTTEMEMEIRHLAGLTLEAPKVKEACRTYLETTKGKRIPAKEFVSFIQSQGDSSALVDALNRFFVEYGCRGYREIDAGQRRYHEDATIIVQQMANAASDRHASMDELRAKGEQAARNLVDACCSGFSFLNMVTCGLWYFLKRKFVTRLVAAIRTAMGHRETPKHFLMKILYAIRFNVLKQATQEFPSLTEEQLLHFTLDELGYLSANPSRIDEAKQIANKRIEDYLRYAKQSNPRVLLSSGENAEYTVMQLEQKNVKDEPNVLRGFGVASGETEGVVRIVLDPAHAELLPGEILVAKNVDPGFNPLFINCKALISEVGGLMTHGSVVCRELGIPGVVSIHNATTRLTNGQRVRVNGTTGIVTIL